VRQWLAVCVFFLEIIITQSDFFFLGGGSSSIEIELLIIQCGSESVRVMQKFQREKNAFL